MRTSSLVRGQPGFALFVALLVAGCSGPEPEADVAPVEEDGVVALSEAQIASAGLRWEPVTRSDVRQTVRVPGSVDAPDTARAVVGSILEGRVARIRVLPGDRVRA
ncbi:MAG: hypothetical protein KJO11_03450, partial [Gemmatimonadetes bacterium]|nr:hypothetical protein [Gemmatimonadota bacterium]